MKNNKTNLNLTVDKPTYSQLPELRNLWKEAFGDSDAFLDTFFQSAFDENRCRCVVVDEKVVAMLYWFECEFQEKPIAYIYAVATAKEMRGLGICHALMLDTHQHLKANGYIGTILVPGNEGLFHFYKGLGYETCTHIEEIVFEDSTLHAFESNPISIRTINVAEYARLRRNYLPNGAIIQEKENLDFLQKQANFYTGDNFLLAAHKSGDSLKGIEFLGNTSAIPSILQTLECTKGSFRTPGKDRPFGMYYSFEKAVAMPNYFGFAFD